MRSDCIDLTGKTFGRWTVLSKAEIKGTTARWLCQCECGATRVVAGQALRSGRTGQCAGCRSKWSPLIKSYRAEYRIWSGMRFRCNATKRGGHKLYSGRGIKVCERWNSFEAFIEDMGPRPSPKHSIDRIDNDGHYEPGNCRWATSSEQMRNRSNNVYVTKNGITKTVSEWAIELGISQEALRQRIAYGWEDPLVYGKQNRFRFRYEIVKHRVENWTPEFRALVARALVELSPSPSVAASKVLSVSSFRAGGHGSLTTTGDRT